MHLKSHITWSHKLVSEVVGDDDNDDDDNDDDNEDDDNVNEGGRDCGRGGWGGGAVARW